MKPESPFQGSLFTAGFLESTIIDLEDWKKCPDNEVSEFVTSLNTILSQNLDLYSLNEEQTKQDIIRPILGLLGWKEFLYEHNMSPWGRHDVPDQLLFASSKDIQDAQSRKQEAQRYEHGTALLEAKRWNVLLDKRPLDTATSVAPPSSQILRYLRRADVITDGKLQWGILTNGRHWRLYYGKARSVSEDFLEINLEKILNFPEIAPRPEDANGHNRNHWLKVFFLVFRRDSFVSSTSDTPTFHLRAITEGRNYEARIADDLSERVFSTVFPQLAKAIASSRPESDLADVRTGTLILLYRLLFLFFAEDRNLLPVWDKRYFRYSVRKLRRDVGEDSTNSPSYSARIQSYWARLEGLFLCLAAGDQAIGLPPYNGGLFEEGHPSILSELRLSDVAIAPIIEALSFEHTSGERKYINYRDLSVQHLGSIYERIMEYDLVRQGTEIAIRLNPYARKNSGSYYTPDDIVQRVLIETIEPLLRRCVDRFEDKITSSHEQSNLEDIASLDPASRMLDIKVCDPAMGSGHFLVAVVDYIADHVIASIARSPADANPVTKEYVSPLAQRIAAIRDTIRNNAEANGWLVDEDRLDDRHIVRRMVLKRCIFGADKNPMAVELAKVSLWLHTFTVGAPLSFLDHHLRCGDSLFGSWVSSHNDNLFLSEPLKKSRR